MEPTGSSPLSTATPAVQKPFDPTARAGYADDMGRFDALMATFQNTGGDVSEDVRINAFESVQTMAVTGRLGGLGEARAKQLHQMLFDSDIGQRSRQLQQSYGATVLAAARSGGVAAAAQAANAFFGKLDGSDQNVLFRTNINAADRTGAKPYADLDAYKANLSTQASLATYMLQSGVIGPNGAIDQGLASQKASGDSRFAAALKLFQAKDNTAATWSQQVARLFGSSADRVDLSEVARKTVGGVSGAGPAGYREGAVASKTV